MALVAGFILTITGGCAANHASPAGTRATDLGSVWETGRSPGTVEHARPRAEPPGGNASAVSPSAPKARLASASPSEPSEADRVVPAAAVNSRGDVKHADLQEPPSEPPMPPAEVTLEDVLDLLSRQSPRVAAIRTEIGTAEAQRIQARLLPNPTFNYEGFTHLRGSTDPNDRQQHLYTLSQPLLLFGQRRARTETADRTINATRARMYADYVELVEAARRLFTALLVNQEQLRLLRETRDEVARVEQIVAGRAEAGLVSQYDLERIRVEAASLDTRLAVAQARVTDASGEMGRLVGLPGWRPRAVGRLRPLDLDVHEEQLLAAIEQTHPRIVAARREELAARSGIDLARREAMPVPEVELGMFHSDGPFGHYLYTGLSIPVLVFDRGQGTLATARAESRTASFHRIAVSAETRAELERALRVSFELRRALDTFDDAVLNRLPRMRRMAEDGYEAGEIRILELLDAIETFLEMQLTYVEYVEAVLHAEIDVLAAAGLIEVHVGP